MNLIARWASRLAWIRTLNLLTKMVALCVGVVVLASASAYAIEGAMVAGDQALGWLDHGFGVSLGLGCTCGAFCVSFTGKAFETAIHHPVERAVGYLSMAVARVLRG